MKPNSIQQEILLVTSTRIPEWQLERTDIYDKSQHLSYTEQLEEACWNGLLDDLLPGTIEKPTSGKKLHLWQVRSGSSFIRIELCTFPIVIEKQLSIDPYFFVPQMDLS
ncbi:MAG: hypothetical protein ABIN89_05165 [Chitinophagaceae bacterium]